MNGLKRFRQDATLELPALDNHSDNHPIRSHRKPRDYSVARGLTVLAIASLTTVSLSLSVVTWTEVEQPTNLFVAAPSVPYSLPDEPPVEDSNSRTVERASRESRDETKPAPVPTSQSERMVSYAMAQLGKPYRFGTQGNSSFDCSGLIVAAYRAATGITLYHYTGRLVREGRSVGRAQLARGDIVFPTPNHVGIYLGNNQMVHASSSKGRVVIGNVYAFYAARRLL